MQTILETIAKFPKEVMLKYDFTKAMYTGALTRIENIQCPTHGVFSQYAAQFRKGNGCPTCGHNIRGANKRLDQQEFINTCKLYFGDKYSYEATIYHTMKDKIIVTCVEHGAFNIAAIKHYYSKQGCSKCAVYTRGVHKSTQPRLLTAITKKANAAINFEAKAKQVHGDAYEYSKVVYDNARAPVEIICKSHGSFLQTPGKHTNSKQGCPQCSHHKSKGEAEIAKILKKFTIVQERVRSLIAPKELDIYLPEHNMAIEYCGEYWHASFNAEEETKTKHRHYDKYKSTYLKGIRLLTIYESEWLDRKPQIVRLLRASIGKLRGKVMARKCVVGEVTHADAVKFFDKYHVQGGKGAGIYYGLYHNKVLVACMRFSYGINDRGAAAKNKEWTLSRYATRVRVVGGASKLYNTFVKEHNPEVVKSFSDNRYFTGGMYEKLNFKLEEETAPDYQVWSPKLGLKPKAQYQRRCLSKMQKLHDVVSDFDAKTDVRSEREITYSLGCGRIYDCGKKRWVWTKQPDVDKGALNDAN